MSTGLRVPVKVVQPLASDSWRRSNGRRHAWIGSDDALVAMAVAGRRCVALADSGCGGRRRIAPDVTLQAADGAPRPLVDVQRQGAAGRLLGELVRPLQDVVSGARCDLSRDASRSGLEVVAVNLDEQRQERRRVSRRRIRIG